MEMNIRGDKIKVTDSMKNYITEKLSKLDKYFGNQEIKCNVVIKVKEKDQIIEVTIPANKFTLRAEEKHTDLYAATDLVIDKLERQIRKNKTKLTKYKTLERVMVEEEVPEKEEFSKIIKRKTLEIKPMDEEEAMLQMDLIDHDFFVFNNIDEGCISVLYKRKDGSCGIINTK